MKGAMRFAKKKISQIIRGAPFGEISGIHE
jgi:hypothetical protein